MARASGSRSKPTDTKRRRREVQFPARYSHEYPVGEGHHYSLNAIPLNIWERAKRRAHGEERAIRVVLIRALELYGNGRIDV